MSGKILKEKTKNILLKRGSKYEFIRDLILENFFDSPKTTTALIAEVRCGWGKKLKPIEVQTYMKKFMAEKIIRAIKVQGHKGNFWVLADVSREEVLGIINKNKKILAVEDELFSDKLIKNLSKNFSIELDDLQYNFGKSGNCTAFLLRKILEKLIYIVFSKHRLQTKLEDKTKPGGLVGLETMINLASSEKIHGIPFLMTKTAKEIKGIKFLGDVSAHNPLTNVDTRTIIPQMPYIITAYEELSSKL